MRTILTPFQKAILEEICKDKFIIDNFVFGGGTALSEFYLQHRLSEDLDFFTENEISFEKLRTSMDKIAKKLKIKSVEYREIQSAKVFFLKRGGKEVIKTDFNYFPYYHFERGKKYKNLTVQSLADIATSKLDTILNRKQARDFVDFYFLQKEHPFSLEFLLKRIKEKFRWKVDPLYLASCFLKAENLQDYPKMIKTFSRKDMISYFINLAKDQKKNIFLV